MIDNPKEIFYSQTHTHVHSTVAQKMERATVEWKSICYYVRMFFFVEFPLYANSKWHAQHSKENDLIWRVSRPHCRSLSLRYFLWQNECAHTTAASHRIFRTDVNTVYYNSGIFTTHYISIGKKNIKAKALQSHYTTASNMWARGFSLSWLWNAMIMMSVKFSNRKRIYIKDKR